MSNENNAGVDLDRLSNLIADDGFAISFQSMSQYRSMLLREIEQTRRASASQISKDAGGVSVEQVPELPKSNDGKEQDAFEAWAGSERYDMATHPIHWLFLNERTDAARQGWKAALEYIGKVMSAGAAAKTEQAPELAIELVGVREAMAEGGGFWSSCSGCYDTEDGHPTGPYSYSRVFGCALGSGCSECGGIGAVWDNTDYEAMHAEVEPASAAGAVSEQAIKTWQERYNEMGVGPSFNDKSVAMMAEIADLRAALALARAPLPEQDDDARDAARYRAWRDHMLANDPKFVDAMQDALPAGVGASREPTAAEWDAAVDAAMRGGV
jgi:hypothetical protein